MNYWNEIYRENPRIWGSKSNALVEFLGNHLEPGQSVLDLGCGTGRDCLSLSQKGILTIGVDISEEAINCSNDLIRENAISSAYFIRADFSEFINQYRGRCFDGILSINSLNHAYDSLEIVIQKLYEILSPNGYLCLSVFSIDDEEWIHYKQMDQRNYFGPFGIIRLYSEEEIRYCLKKFRILKLSQTTYLDNPHFGSPEPHKNSFLKVIAEKN